MAHQKHDTGQKKRAARERARIERAAQRGPNSYALDLVRRGLASAQILTSEPKRRPQAEPCEDTPADAA